MNRVKNIWSLLKRTVTEFSNDNVTKLSASLAYYTVFSLGPLIMVVISLTSLFFEDKAVKWQVYWQIKDLIGQETADQVITVIQNMQDNNASTFSIISIGILIFGATTIFADMQGSINYIWSIRAKPEKGWLKFLKNRLLSFSMVLGISFLLIVSLLVNTAVDLFAGSLMSKVYKEAIMVYNIFNVVLLFVIITSLFAVIYKVLPDATIKWKDAFVGASFTGVLFMIGKYLISLYLSSSNMHNTYGASASIVVLLSWVYYTSIILYFGAEFTKVYALKFGKGISPAHNAVFIIKQEAKEISP